MSENNKTIITDGKKVFFKKGTCSQAFFYILNREFGNNHQAEEWAADPLAGGILRQGYQCGMLWGATLAAEAEAYRRTGDLNKAAELAMNASQKIVKSFTGRTKTVECADITETDMSNNLMVVKYLLTGKARTCYGLAADWATEAFEAAEAGLLDNNKQSKKTVLSCASEVVKQMGGTDEEAAMVAGFAGGIGFSGNACGALAAAIWLVTLRTIQKQNKKPGMKNPQAEELLKAFQGVTSYEMECAIITEKNFKDPHEHTDFLQGGGCKKIIETLTAIKNF